MNNSFNKHNNNNYTNLLFDIISSVAVGSFIGYGIGKYFDCSTCGWIVGFLLGAVTGIYKFYLQNKADLK